MNHENGLEEKPDDAAYRIGRQVHDHEARIRLLERDYSDTRSTLDAMTTSINGLIHDFDNRLSDTERRIRDAFTTHEKTELLNQTRIMTYLISILLTIIGSAATILLSKIIGAV